MFSIKLNFVFPQVMRRRRVAAVRQRTPAVNLREMAKTGSKAETTMKKTRTEGKGGGRPVAVVAKAAKKGPEKCETRKRSLAATTTATTTSPRIQPGAVGRRAVTVKMKGTTEEAAGAAVPLQHAATTAATTQRCTPRVGVGVRGLQTPVMPATVNKVCSLESMGMMVLPAYSAPNLVVLTCH